MAILMDLPKEDNVLYTDFPNAYWSIENIIFSTSNGVAYTQFSFFAYASRESKYKGMYPVEVTLSWGGPIGLAYMPRLHSWEATFPTLDIFPDGIPVQESDQKDILYGFIKDYLNLSDVIDVLEEGDE